jgi:hypothetical protein
MGPCGPDPSLSFLALAHRNPIEFRASGPIIELVYPAICGKKLDREPDVRDMPRHAAAKGDRKEPTKRAPDCQGTEAGAGMAREK